MSENLSCFGGAYCPPVVERLPAFAHDVDMRKLPLGDGKISHGPKAGWIWACHVDPQAGGAQVVGPWIDEKAGTYDMTAKIAVRGAVTWPHKFNVTVKGDRRVFSTNDLPAASDRSFSGRAQRSGL